MKLNYLTGLLFVTLSSGVLAKNCYINRMPGSDNSYYAIKECMEQYNTEVTKCHRNNCASENSSSQCLINCQIMHEQPNLNCFAKLAKDLPADCGEGDVIKIVY